MVENIDEKIYAYALENAHSHEGRAQESSVLSHLFKDGLKKEEIREVMPKIKEAVRKVNSLNPKELEEAFSNYKQDFEKLKELKRAQEKERELPELPNVREKMVFRMAPYPSGALHIGNAKQFVLNALYAEKYNGKLILFIDDTIGSEAKPIVKEAYELIPESLDWLGIKYDKEVLYKSDRLEIYYEYAEKLINLGRAYVCSCRQEALKKNREKGIECECRILPVEKQIERWKKMFKAKQGKYTLRIKTDMKNPNPAFRDRVLFKITERKHPRAGNKHRVWPTMEMSWAVDDHLIGVTHIIRGIDLVMETEMEKEIWSIFGWEHPTVVHTGFFTIEGIEGAKISKSKAQAEIKSGKFMGWDDPRTWSIQSLKRRGFIPEVIREFIKRFGINQNNIVAPIENFYSINRKMIDSTANRYFFVEAPKKIVVEDFPASLNSIDVPIHPEKTELRKLKVFPELYISEKDFNENKGREVRLTNLFNVILNGKTKFLDSADKSVQKIQWVSDKFKVRARILMPDGKWSEGFAEKNIEKLKADDVIQFERVGFVRYDKKKGATYEFWFAHR